MTSSAHSVLRAGSWSGEPADIVVLTRDDRHRRRMKLTGEVGLSFLLDLAEATVLHDGDALELGDGRLVVVRAAPEKLIEVRGTDPHHLLRLAWHLGNRHVPTAIEGDRLLIGEDHVLADMVRGLGGTATAIEAPFDPEAGAYAHGSHDHGDGHHHDHHGSHDHDYGRHHRDHSHAHSHGHSHEHDHGHGGSHG
ncbi:MAG: urease accessory protein UreE [Hyphomicrobiales bacterium]|nr:MAG: urease accessory protein UreE [Hyphomicrobiales bacterium]